MVHRLKLPVRSLLLRVALAVAAMLPGQGAQAGRLQPEPMDLVGSFYQRQLQRPGELNWKKLWLTPELYRELAAQERQTRRALRRNQSPQTQLDPFTGGTVPPTGFRIVSATPSGSDFRVELQLQWHGPAAKKDKTHTVMVLCKQYRKCWRIDDVFTAEGSARGFLLENAQ